MNKATKSCLLLMLCLITASASAALPAPASANSIVATLEAAMKPAILELTKLAITWLAAFSALQLIITNYGVLKSGGDIDAVIAKTAGAVAWIGVCIYLINNAPAFIADVGDSLFSVLGIVLPDPESVMLTTFGWVSAIAALALATGVFSDAGSTILINIMFLILAVGMFVAFKIFMLHLELAMIVMLSPLSFALLGLNALKDQGIAPFKSLLALAYKILLITIILSAFTQVGNTAKDAFTSIDTSNLLTGLPDAISAALSAIGAYLLLFFLVWKTDSLSASLASGSSSMGTGDIAGAAAAGAAAGALIASGGAAAATATKLPGAIPSGINNASKSGSGPSSAWASNSTSMPKPEFSAGPAAAPVNPDSGSMKSATPEQRHATITGESPEGAASNKGASASLGARSEGASPAVASAAQAAASGGQTPGAVGAAVLGAGGTQTQAMAAAGNMAAGSSDGGNRGLEGGQLNAGVSSMKSGASSADAAKAMMAAGATSKQAHKAAEAMAAVRDGASQSARNEVPNLNSPAGFGGSAAIGAVNQTSAPAAAAKTKKSAWEQLGNANQHVAQEKATTHVSINTHHSD